VSSNDVVISTFGPDWDRLPDALELTYTVLMAPYGVDREVALAHAEHEAEHVAAVDADGTVIGYLRLLPRDDAGSMQVRQVAVAESWQRRGLGRALMRAAEARAREEGAHSVWLNARVSAVAFYERLGYDVVSDEFVTGLAGLPHRRMRTVFDHGGEGNDTP